MIRFVWTLGASALLLAATIFLGPKMVEADDGESASKDLGRTRELQRFTFDISGTIDVSGTDNDLLPLNIQILDSSSNSTWPSFWTTTSDSDGFYSFVDIPTGTYSMFIMRSDISSMPPSYELTLDDSQPTTVSEGNDFVVDTFNFEVSGTVAREDAFGFVYLQLLESDGPFSYFRSAAPDIDGFYSFVAVPPGNYSIYMKPDRIAMPPSYSVTFDDSQPTVSEGNDFVVTSFEISGTVVTEDVSGIDNDLLPLSIQILDSSSNSTRSSYWTTTSDSDGFYSFVGIPTGTYSMFIIRNDISSMPPSYELALDDSQPAVSERNDFVVNPIGAVTAAPSVPVTTVSPSYALTLDDSHPAVSEGNDIVVNPTTPPVPATTISLSNQSAEPTGTLVSDVIVPTMKTPLVPATVSCSTTYLEEGVDYRIVPRHDNSLALSIQGDSIVLRTKETTGNDQIWSPRRVGSEMYHFVNAGENAPAINVAKASVDNKANIIPWPLSTPNSDNDDWCLQSVTTDADSASSNYFYLIAAHVLQAGGDAVMDVTNAGRSEGTTIVQYARRSPGVLNQQFQFERVGPDTCKVCVSPEQHEATTAGLQTLIEDLTSQLSELLKQQDDNKGIVDQRLSALEGSSAYSP